MLMVIVSTRHVSSHALAAHHTKQSLSLPHRCCVHYILLVALLLFVHRYAYSFMLCLYHRVIQLLYFIRRSYFERSPGIPCLDSVFFTIPCMFWHHPHRKELCCILYNNTLVLSSLTVSLMCLLLQHYLYPFSCTYHSVKTQRAHKLVLKIGQKSSLLCVVFITSLGYSSLSITRHKNTPLFAVYVCYPFISHFCV